MRVTQILLIMVSATFCIGFDSSASPILAPGKAELPARSNALGQRNAVQDDGSFKPRQRYEYRLLATNKTSTMQKEMNEASLAGFRFEDVMGGETSFGGSEVVVVMSRDPEVTQTGRYMYKLLATSKTSTMQKEMQEAANAGYQYWGQTVFNTSFGGDEVILIMERDTGIEQINYEYLLLATKKSGTMQKELSEAGEQGFHFVGLTVGATRFAGNELVSILRRKVER